MPQKIAILNKKILGTEKDILITSNIRNNQFEYKAFILGDKNQAINIAEAALTKTTSALKNESCINIVFAYSEDKYKEFDMFHITTNHIIPFETEISDCKSYNYSEKDPESPDNLDRLIYKHINRDNSQTLQWINVTKTYDSTESYFKLAQQERDKQQSLAVLSGLHKSSLLALGKKENKDEPVGQGEDNTHIQASALKK